MEQLECVFNRTDVEAQLASGLSKVVFIKLDGTERELIATRDMTIIPWEKHPSVGRATPNESGVVPVYDTEEECWKSFILANLISLEKV